MNYHTILAMVENICEKKSHQVSFSNGELDSFLFVKTTYMLRVHVPF